MASDSLNESVTRVVILIKDSNDLPPIFNQTMYTAHALEELADPLPFKLLQVASTYNSGFFISFFIPKNPVEFIYFQACVAFVGAPNGMDLFGMTISMKP